jgi:hypothetical protein
MMYLMKKLVWNPTVGGTSEITSVGIAENIGDLGGVREFVILISNAKYKKGR